MDQASAIAQLTAVQSFYASGATQSLAWRRQQLNSLKRALIRYEEKINEALYIDLKKNREEAWVTELGFTIAEKKAA